MFGIKYIIRKRQLGDVLWIEPIIRQIAAKEKKVIVFTKFNDLFLNFPLPNVIFKSNLNFFEKVFCFIETNLNTHLFFINLENSYEIAPKQHILHAYQKKANVFLLEEYPKLYLNREETTTRLFNHDNYVVLHLESFSDKKYRKVFGINWDDVVTFLNEKGFRVITVGKMPYPVKNAEHLQTSIRELINIIYHCSFFIGIDSGPSHIAASLQKPCLLFFGAINPQYRHFPSLFKGYFLQQYCEFAGCYHDTITHTGSPCKLFAEDEIPKCVIFSNEYIYNKINNLLHSYLIPDDTKVNNKG